MCAKCGASGQGMERSSITYGNVPPRIQLGLDLSTKQIGMANDRGELAVSYK